MNNTLCHYGVLGMRWGVRNANPINNIIPFNNKSNIVKNDKIIDLVEGVDYFTVKDKIKKGKDVVNKSAHKKVPKKNAPVVNDGKNMLIALGIVAGTAAVIGGIYTYRKKKKQQEANIMNNNIKHSDTLCHYGVAGQKWGIRRFQNEDGSLTNKGKRQYMKESKISGANKGAIAGMIAGGATAAAMIGKSHLSSHQAGKAIKFRFTREGNKILNGILLGGLGGMMIGKLAGKRRGKTEIAEYGKQYITTKFEEPKPAKKSKK